VPVGPLDFYSWRAPETAGGPTDAINRMARAKTPEERDAAKQDLVRGLANSLGAL